MENYTHRRFLKMLVYFFAMYCLLTAIWFGASGQFTGDLQQVILEIIVSAAVFAVGFSVLMAILYRRREFRIPSAKTNQAALEKLLSEVGYEKAEGKGAADYKVFNPKPPKATRMAGKLFIRKSANFYFLNRPAKYLNQLEMKLQKKLK